MHTVEFIKPWKIYSPGDVAGFEADQAKILIDGKVVKPHEEDTKAAKAAKKSSASPAPGRHAPRAPTRHSAKRKQP